MSVIRHCREMLGEQWSRENSVCVGLDLDYEKIPADARYATVEDTLYEYGCEIVHATADLVCAYKPNIAFYEAQGTAGINALILLIDYIHERASDVPVILDVKRGDTRDTNVAYVKAAFEVFKADAATVSPYLGRDALQPFLDREEKEIIVLCRTSNDGAAEFQDLPVSLTPDDMKVLLNGPARQMYVPDHCGPTMPFFWYVALRVANNWNMKGNCGLVMGATWPEQLSDVRVLVGDMAFLIPGVGFQLKEPLEEGVRKVVKAGKDSQGRGMIINASRSIIYASSGPDFAEAARRKTVELRDLINRYRGETTA